MKKETLPLYTFAQINDSFIRSAYRLKGGGGQIAESLAADIEKMGGIVKKTLVQNAIVDATGNYLASYWVIIAGLAYMLFYALIGSKNVNKDIPTE